MNVSARGKAADLRSSERAPPDSHSEKDKLGHCGRCRVPTPAKQFGGRQPRIEAGVHEEQAANIAAMMKI